MTRDHFIPASVLGQFSANEAGPLRTRQIAVLRPGTDPYMTRAENVGFVNKLYQGPNGTRSSVDDTWTQIEAELPKVTSALESSTSISARDWLRVLVPYVAMLFVRGREWEERYMHRFRDAWGRELLAVDSVESPSDEVPRESDEVDAWVMARNGANEARLMELQRLLAPVACARWVISHVPKSCALITNDIGLGGTMDTATGNLGWIAPLSQQVAVSIFPCDRREVVLWTGKSWAAQLAHFYPSEANFGGLNDALAATAHDFVVGKDIGSLSSLRAPFSSSAGHFPLMNAWPFTSAEKRQNELHWHRLVSLTHWNQHPTLLPSGEVAEGLVDWQAVAADWSSKPFLGVNTTPRAAGFTIRNGTIEMSLRGKYLG